MRTFAIFNIQNDCEYHLLYITTNRKEAVEKYKKEYLPSFLLENQCENVKLELCRLELLRKDYELFKESIELFETLDRHNKIEGLLKLFCKNSTGNIMFSVSEDEVFDIVNYYCEINSIKIPTDDNILLLEKINEIAKVFNENKNLYSEIIKKYIEEKFK